MTDQLPPLSSETRALMDRERQIPPLPPAVHARAVARARSAVASGAVPAPAPAHGVPSWARWAAAATLTAAVSATAVAMVFRGDTPSEEAPAPLAAPFAVPTAPAGEPPSTIALPAPEVTTNEYPRRSKMTVPWEELRLLKQARAAVARRDFAAALGPIAEHARHFKDGRLVEEREALRVKALAGLGHTAAAKHAAVNFETLFPKSVLLPAVRRISSSAP